MKSFLKFTLILGLLIALLAVAGGLALWHGMSLHPEFGVSINGEDLRLHELHAGHWAGGMLGALIAALVLLVLLSLVLLLGLGLPLLIASSMLGLALLALLSLGGLLLSPLLLLALPLWLLLRRDRQARPRDVSATQP